MRARKSRGRSSSPRNGTTTMPVVRKAARKRRPRLPIGSPGPVHGNVGRIEPLNDLRGEAFALGFADEQQALAAVLLEKPAVEVAAGALRILEQDELAAEAVIPHGAVVFEVVGGVLAVVHLGE